MVKNKCTDQKWLAGSTVLHKPSGERWLLACNVEDDRVFWIGYPFGGYGYKKDCELVKDRGVEYAIKILEDVARSKVARELVLLAKNSLRH